MGRADIRLIVFDFGGVVCRFDYRIFCDRLSRRCGCRAEEILAAGFGGPLQLDLESGRISGGEYHATLARRLGIHVPYAEFCLLYGDIFAEIPPTLDLLHRLHRRYPLYLLSDTNEIHFAFVRERIPALRLFSQYVLSYEVGAMKPDERIYREVLRRSGLPAEACLFVDDRQPNVEGAARLGMQAVRYESPAQLEADLLALGVETGAPRT